MAEENEARGEDAPQKKGSPVFTLAIVALILTVPIIAALVTWAFVLRPALNPPSVEAGAARQQDEQMPRTVTPVAFDDGLTNVLRENEDYPASILMYKVAMDASNAETAAMIEAHKPRVNAIISDMHKYHTRRDLEDPLVQRSIQKQIMDKTNEYLRKLGAGEGDEVLAVYHENFMVRD